VPSTNQAVTIMLTIMIMLVMYSEYILYTLYLRSVGQARKDRYLASGTLPGLIMVCVVLGIKVILLIIMAAMNPTTPAGMKTSIIISSLVAMAASGLLITYALMHLRLSIQGQNAAS